MMQPCGRFAAFARALYTPGSTIPSPALVFLAVALVSALQIPASFLIRAEHISTGVLVNELVAIAGVPIALVWLLRFERRRVMPLNIPGAAVIALVIMLTCGAVIVMDFTTAASEHFFPLPSEIEAQYDLMMNASAPAAVVWKFFILCLVPGVCEEIFFRGFCQGSLAWRWGNAMAIFVTAVIFAALHGNPWYFHLYILLGILFGWVFAVTGSLWASILCHVLNNSWTFFNHLRGFELPIEGASIFFNGAIFFWGAAFIVVAVTLLRRQMQIMR